MALGILSDVIRYAYKALTEKKVRAVLTIIGISIGPLALVMMTSLVRGYSNYIEEQLTTLGQNTIVLFSTSEYILKSNDLDYVKNIDGVDDASPFYSSQGFIDTPYGRITVYVYAIDPDTIFKAIGGLEILEGDAPSSTEVTYGLVGYFVAFDESTRERIYEVGDAVTIQIPEVTEAGRLTIKRLTIRIKGVLSEYGGALFISPDKTIILPYEAGTRVLRMRDWSGIFVVAKSPEYVHAISEELREAYGNKISIVAFQQIAQAVSSVTAAIEFITFSTSLAAFAVAVAGTAATMITSVVERTREIGVLKALGFTDGQVTLMIIAESLLMSMIGAAIGMSIGVIGANILASKGMVIRGATTIVIQAPPDITLELILRTLAITISVGVTGGAFPAYRAAKIPPAVALRYE